MKKPLMLAGLVLLLAACSNGIRPPNDNSRPPSVNNDKGYVEGQVVVGYTSDANVNAIAAWTGGDVLQDWPQIHAALIKLPSGFPTEKAEKLLRQLSTVRYSEPNRVYEKPRTFPGVTDTSIAALSTYSDPEIGRQWMHRQMKTAVAWDAGITGSGVRIGIHDDFIDHNHPDLHANIAYPGFYGTTATLICPDTPHNGKGTHGSSVAGTAAAVANSIGGRGVAYGAKIVPIAIDDPDNGFLTDVGIVNGGLFAALGPEALGFTVPEGCGGYTPPQGRPYVDIVNMSWGSGAYSQVTKDLMDFMLLKGIILVTSAGNTPTTGFAEPAWYPGLITVAATQANGHRTDFSNRGVHLDVAAPGENIWVPTTRRCILSDPSGAGCSANDADYTYIAGTSFSSPATAGATALVLQAAGGGGSLDARQARAVLTSTANDANAAEYPGFDEDLGWGIVDAGAAALKAKAIYDGIENAPAPGALLQVFVYDSNTNTPLPLTGAALQPLDENGEPLEKRPILLSQTTGSGLFSQAGAANFFQIDPGRYRVYVSGPLWKKTGITPGLAYGVIDVPSGAALINVGLDVQLPTDPNEPNDDSAHATPAEAGKTYKGILYAESGSDVDYYSMAVDNGSKYYVNTEKLAGSADLKLTVYASDGTTVIASNDNNRDFAKDALVTFIATSSETYYIAVEDASAGSSPFNSYALDIALAAGDEVEPNGSATVSNTSISAIDFSDAQPLSLGSEVDAAIDPAGDDDFYAIDLTAGTTLVTDTETTTNGAPDTMIAVYDSSGNQVAFNDDFSGRESRLEYTPDTAGTYYILISSWDGDGPDGTTGNYSVSFTSLAQ